MSFLAPWMLIGLIGASVPIIIHLLRKHQAHTVIWGAYKFLMESIIRRRRRMILEEILLLACRTLVLAFFSLALARPFISQISIPFTGTKGSSDVAIVIDGSTSMGLRQADGRSNFELSIHEAKDLISEAPRGTSFAIIKGGAASQVMTPVPLNDKRELFTILDSMKPGVGTMNAPRMLADAAMVLAAGNQPGKQIVVYGDGQAEGWDTGNSGLWKTVGEMYGKFAVKPIVVWRTMPLPATIRNASVKSIKASRDVIGIDREVTFDAVVANAGTETVTPKSVRLVVNGETVESKVPGRLLPDASSTISFEYRFKRAGVYEVAIAVDSGDDLPQDDSCATAVHVIDSLGVLIADGRYDRPPLERASTFLSTALMPADKAATSLQIRNDFLVRPTTVKPESLDDESYFSTPSVVVLTDVPSVSEKALTNIVEFVKRGGGFLFVPGPSCNRIFWNNWKVGGEQVLPGGLPPFVTTVKPGAKPEFTEAKLGSGTVSLASLPLDISLTAFPAKPEFVQMCHETIYRLAEGALSHLAMEPSNGGAIMLAAGSQQRVGKAHGVTAEYFRNGDKEKSKPIFTENLDTIACFWGEGSPNDKVPRDQFKAHFYGELVVPVDGEYRLKATGDDYAIVQIGTGKAAIKSQHNKEISCKLKAGEAVPLNVWMVEWGGNANVSLLWMQPNDVTWSTVPTDALIRKGSIADAEARRSAGAEIPNVRIVGPDGRKFDAVCKRTPRGPFVTFNESVTPGLWHVKMDPAVLSIEGLSGMLGGLDYIPFEVRGESNESNLRQMEPEELNKIGESVAIVMATQAKDVMAAINGKSFGTEIWRPLAFIVLLLMVAEVWLTRWIAIGRETGNVAPTSFAWKRFFMYCGIMFAVYILLIKFMTFFLVMASPWSEPFLAVLSALASAGAFVMYDHERLIVGEKLGKILVALRLAAVFCVLWMLYQPTLVLDGNRKVRRRVAVLLDDSLSMYRPDVETNGVKITRSAAAKELLSQGWGTNKFSLVEELAKNYDVDLFDLGSDILKKSDLASLVAGATNSVPEDTFFSSETDYTKALENVLSVIPSEEFAGALLITDGRNTSPVGMEAVARRYGRMETPISTVMVGSTNETFDLAIEKTSASENLFLGDKLRVNVVLSADNANGRKMTVRLFRGEEEVDKQDIEVDADEFEKDIRLVDEPKEKGIVKYRVAIDPVPGEAEHKNNSWEFETAVSDDRTNVLLVDSRPRWEFRYLRNLFYGRDKSVHLQYYLTEPDGLPDEKRQHAPASASREFGDAEATALPVNRDEWKKFDVIIIGDVGEDVLNAKAVSDISYCVGQRGATLVFICGAHFMPSAITSTELLGLMPVVPKWRNAGYKNAKQTAPGYRVQLTGEGRAHPCMILSDSISENDQLWAELPPWRYREYPASIKPGAEVLAWGEDVSNSKKTEKKDDEDLDPVKRLDQVRKREASNALIVTSVQGRGKVAMILSDETWRLRYRVGDTYHHRFWGQLLKWGAGEKLRSGNKFVRLGTDKLTYMPGEPVKVTARLANKDSSPMLDRKVTAIITTADGKQRKLGLEMVPDSNGVYEGTYGELLPNGQASLYIDTGDVVDILGKDFPTDLLTTFNVSGTPQPVEFVWTTASDKVPATMARLSGGRVVSPENALDLANAYGETGAEISERSETSFWDTWLLLPLIIALLFTEWHLRRKAGLA